MAAIIHKWNRKYKALADLTGIKRNSMSFLFTDLRQLLPQKPAYDELLKKFQPKATFFLAFLAFARIFLNEIKGV